MDDKENPLSEQTPRDAGSETGTGSLADSGQDSDSVGDDSRWVLFRDVLKFQAKLVVDGLRDALMIPVSLVAALAGLVMEPGNPARLFNKVLDFGRKTESWINLFGRPEEDPGIDELFGRLEQRIKEQYDRGGITASAKDTIDGSLDRLNEGVGKLRQRIEQRVTEEVAAAGKNDDRKA
ncbi:MAG: hypothetical protein QNJ40_04890 [Xanthomonadales bacterium]|nr:hypothetical protein [Xanthomonadales bacterium]